MEERNSTVGSAANAVSSLSKKVIAAAVLVLLAYILIRLCFSFGRSLFYVDPAEAAPGTDVEITVETDDDINTLADRLYEDGVITNALSFKVQGTLYETELYPGTYTVNTSMTIKEMLSSMAERAEELEETAVPETAAFDGGSEIVGGYEGDPEAQTSENADAGSTVQEESEGNVSETEIIGGGYEGE